MNRNTQVDDFTQSVFNFIAYIAMCAVLALVMSGCYTQKKALRQVAKAHNTYPQIPAKFCAEMYDPTDSVHILKEYIQGEDVVYTDTVVEVYNVLDTVTIVKYLTRTVKSVDTVRDTKYITTENKAGLKLRDGEIAELKQALTETLADRQMWRNWAIWLGIAWIVAILAFIVWLWVKSKTKIGI